MYFIILESFQWKRDPLPMPGLGLHLREDSSHYEEQPKPLTTVKFFPKYVHYLTIPKMKKRFQKLN